MPDRRVALVVEDHDFQRRMVARMLRSLGIHDVKQAADGNQALAVLRDAPGLDLIVCDLDMPGMDGMEFIRHLSECSAVASLIICSAQDRPILASVEKMTRAYGVRLLGLIEKPVTLIGLEDLIAGMNGASSRRPAAPTAVLSGIDPADILHGLQHDQFEPFFQPKADIGTGRIVGVEALARWRHPEGGIVGPYEFVAPLERSGAIDLLTYVIIRKAATACAAWRELGLNISVSVNVSAVSLADTTLADRVTNTVRAAGLDPRHMILEITETAALSDVGSALENLARLRIRGFGLSIDDYGTGFASLQQLTRIPFTELKIDQGFITGCTTDPSSAAVVVSSVVVARRLRIATVAEGVEIQAEWDYLKKIGCQMAQGYFIAKPMEQSQFPAFCARW